MELIRVGSDMDTVRAVREQAFTDEEARDREAESRLQRSMSRFVLDPRHQGVSFPWPDRYGEKVARTVVGGCDNASSCDDLVPELPDVVWRCMTGGVAAEHGSETAIGGYRTARVTLPAEPLEATIVVRRTAVAMTIASSPWPVLSPQRGSSGALVPHALGHERAAARRHTQARTWGPIGTRI